MSNQNQAMQKSNVSTIKDKLMSTGTIELFKSNLPNAVGKHAEDAAKRFAKMTYTAITQNSLLQQCTPASIIKAASQAASLQLDIDIRGLAYLVPYYNNNLKAHEAQFQIGYMGLIELAYRSGKVKAISAHCIYESERKSIVIDRTNGQFSVKHPFSFDAPTGNIIAVYASAEVEGLGSQTVVLRADEIERLRKLSKAANSPAWQNHYEAMAKKTAIRQLAKFLPKSILEDFSRAAADDEAQDYRESFTEAQVVSTQAISEATGSEVVDFSDSVVNGVESNDIDEISRQAAAVFGAK